MPLIVTEGCHCAHAGGAGKWSSFGWLSVEAYRLTNGVLVLRPVRIAREVRVSNGSRRGSLILLVVWVSLGNISSLYNLDCRSTDSLLWSRNRREQVWEGYRTRFVTCMEEANNLDRQAIAVFIHCYFFASLIWSLPSSDCLPYGSDVEEVSWQELVVGNLFWLLVTLDNMLKVL